MSLEDDRIRMQELNRQIAELPSGSVGTKTVKGKVYHYHRWYENGKRREKFIPEGSIEDLRARITKRRGLEAERKALAALLPPAWEEDLRYGMRQPASSYNAVREETASYGTNAGFSGTEEGNGFTAVRSAAKESYAFQALVRTGRQLQAFAEPVRGWRHRGCYRVLREYILGEFTERVLILYGLRRTGKTTMIRQILAEMQEDQLARAAFLQIRPGNTMADVNRDLQMLEERGCRYVFLDEVTMMEDFTEGAALFPDIFAASGMRIVLSGTDSLGFLFAEDEQLYDRCILLHTTFIPYREFEDVLGIRGVEEYIRYGGTMSLGGIHYNASCIFADRRRTDEYVDTAIAHNIQHSLRCYQRGGHLRHLRELYEKDELTSAINRVVEDINHRFTLEVLTRRFRSSDLSISAGNLRRDRRKPTDILDRIDINAVTERIRRQLEIRNLEEQSVSLDEESAEEIKEYLELLDLVREMDVVSLPGGGVKSRRIVLTQPGLRWSQADALVESLLADETFSDLSLTERREVLGRIQNEIRGRMLEDLVLLETQAARPKCQVFTVQFAVGEFDMVVFDPGCACCSVYEIKHSMQAVPEQCRHLTDDRKCEMTEHRYGPVQGKYILYRGEDQRMGEVQYRNVEEYLRSLWE